GLDWAGAGASPRINNPCLQYEWVVFGADSLEICIRIVTTAALSCAGKEGCALGGIADDDCVNVHRGARTRCFDPRVQEFRQIGALLGRKTTKGRHSSIGPARIQERPKVVAV